MKTLLTRMDKGMENACLYWEKYQVEQDEKDIQKLQKCDYEPNEIEESKFSNSIRRSGESNSYFGIISGYCCARPDAPYEEIKEFMNEWRAI